MKTMMRMGMMLALMLAVGAEAWAVDASGTWKFDGSGNWSDTSKWTSDPAGNYPGGVGKSATITNNTTASAVITQDTSVVLGSILIGDGTANTFDVVATGGATITMNTGTASPATLTKRNGATRSSDSFSAPLILQSDLAITNDVNGTYNFSVNGAISEGGGKRNVTCVNNHVGAIVYLNSTNSSYSGKTTVRYGEYSFASIGNLGGNSSLGAPTNAVDGTIDIGDGANNVTIRYSGTANARTDRILNFVGTTGGPTIAGLSAAGVLTYTSPFQFSGVGAKTLTLRGVAVLGNMDKPDLTVTAATSGSGWDAKGVYLLGLNNYTNKTSVSKTMVVINSLSSVANPQPSSLGAPTTVANGTIDITDIVGSCVKYIGIGHTSDRVLNMASTTGGLNLDASGYGRFTLTSPLTTAAGSGPKTVTLQGAGEGEMQGAIPDGGVGATALSKIGSGTWTLKGDNSSGFTGTITINGAGGTLEVGHDNALNSGVLTLTAGNLAAVGAARTINNPITAISSLFGFTGSQDLTLTATIPATANARTFYNTLASGKTLTLGAMNLTPDTTARTTTFEGGGDTVISGAIANGGGNGALAMSGTGTLTLKGANTYTNGTSLNAGGTLVLDYTSQDNSKLDNSAALTLGGANMGGTLILTNSAGNHIEQVGSTALNAGGIRVIRPNGGAILRLQVLTRAAGGTIDFGADSIADISLANVNSILGGWATVGGTNWAVGGAGNTPVTALSSYTTPFPAAGPGNSANNYFHNVAGQAQAAVAANSLKIANGQNNDTLTLNGNLTNTSLSATSLGGILYVGGYDNTYTIGGTGRILASGGAQELIFNVYTGTLTVTAPIHASAAAAGSLTKTGAGKLVVNNANAFTGATRVNQGTLSLKDSSALGTSSSVSVQRGAAVELEGGGVNLARSLTIHGAGPDGSSGALKNVSGANTWSGAIAVGTGGARIGNADTGNTLTLSGGITTVAWKDLTLGGAGNIVVNTTKITSTGQVIKDGTGTVELAVANDYTGATTVNAGTLKVTGSIANGSKVTVNSGGTLSGSGTCYGEVWVKSGGTIKPDGGNLTVSNLVLFGGCTNVFNVGGAGSNIVVSAFGEMVLQKGLTIAATSGNKVKVWANGTVLPNSTNSLIQYSGDLNGSVANLEMANDPSPGSPYSFIATNGYVALVAGASFSPPTIQPDQASIETNMLEDAGALNLAGLGLYATDPDGTSWVWTNTTTPANGSVVCNGSGKDAPVTWTGGFTYTPNPNFNGTNSFVVRVKDNTDQSDSITVKVVVAAVNDPPVNTVAPGYDPATTFLMDTAWTVTNGVWNDNADTNAGYSGAGLTFAYQWYCSNSPSATPITGATSANYTPGSEWIGSNLCAAVMCIDAGEPGSATGTVFTAWREVLGAANTPPEILVGGSPVESVTTNITEDAATVTLTGFGFTATDDAVGGAGVTWTNSTLPANGSVSVDGTGTNPVTWTGFTYTPSANFNGTNTFVVEARDAIGLTDSVTVTVVVAAVNDAPVNTVTPTYTGTRLIGSNLTVSSVGTWNDNADTNTGYTAATFASGAVYTYQWQRAVNFAGDGLVNIPDATNTTYTLVFADKYKYIRVAVTCTDSGFPGSASATAYSTPWQLEQSVAPAAVTFNKTSDVWTHYLNWTPNDVPLIGIDARIGDPAVCSPATAALGGGDNAVKGLYIATNDNSVGTLNMTGGTLTVGGNSIKVADGASSTGTLNQTGGTISGMATLSIAYGTNSSGTMTLGGYSSITGDLSVAIAPGSVGGLTFAGSSRCSLASPVTVFVGSGSNAMGTLTVQGNALLSMRSTVINPNNRPIHFGAVPCSTGLVEVTGNGVITNASSLFAGVEGFGSLTLSATGRVYCGAVYAGGTNGRAQVTVADAGFLSGQLFLGYYTNASATMVLTNDGVANVSTLTVGDQAYGSLSMGGNSALRVSGVATLGNAAGAEGMMRVTGGSWTQAGALNIGTVAGATGRLTVADCALTGLAGAVTVGGGTTAGDRLGSVTVSNATFGVGAAVTVVTNGFVELTGTGSVFQCSTFTCRGGWVTNRVSRFSGGIDVTNSANTALAITNGGRMHLVFVEGPSSLGEFWGLRWNGSGHAGQVQGLVNNGQLSWDDSAVGGSVVIYTNVTYTMVGYVVDQMGTTFRFR